MAHFAQIDSNNTVTQVIVVANEFAPDEKTGQEFIASIGLVGTWLQTSYNTYGGEHLLGGTPLRKNYASIGSTYDEQREAFISPKPEQTKTSLGEPIVWELDENTCQWLQKVIES